MRSDAPLSIVHQPTEDPLPNPRRGASIAQLSLSLFAATMLWAIAALFSAWGLISLLTGAPPAGDVLQIFMLSAAMAISGLFMLLSAYYAWRRLSGKKPSDAGNLLSPLEQVSDTMFNRLHLEWWIIALPVVILFGHIIAGRSNLAWLLLPPFHLLAVGIPTAWLLYLGIRNLPIGSAQRIWGVFNSGLGLAPLFIMVFETLAALGFLILFGLLLSAQPDLAKQLFEMIPQLQDVQSPDILIEILGPILVNPLVIFSVVLFGAICVPLIEELFKPIGVWLLFGRKMTPAAGFAAGALSGAGYGFIESLALSSTGEQWSTLVLARIGTSAVHILTSALTGWALVQAWQKKRFLQLGLAYLCAVIIHGLWNGLTLLYSFDLLSSLENLQLQVVWLHSIGTIAPFGLILLAVGSFVGLISINRSLQRDPGQPRR